MTPWNDRPVSRREWLQLTSAGVVTSLGVPWFGRLAQAAAPLRKPKACILLWMDGGPSQAHTFDPKPGGEYGSIATAVPGIRMTEYLPKLAARMKDLALLRGMSTAEGDHYRAKYYLHTGYNRVGGFEHPAIGCLASAEVGAKDSPLPSFVTIDAGFDKVNGGRLYRSVPSYVGLRHAPLAVTDPDVGLENLPATAEEAEFAAGLELLRKAETRLGGVPAPAVRAKQAAFDRALALMRSDKARAFNLKLEPEKSRTAYGDHKFGKACLMARRLVESGVSFVEIFHRGWDDHEGAAKRIKPRCEWMDTAMATLLDDLKDRGLLDSTLIVWMGEFGRSPVKGDGHYARAWTTLMAGGGIKTGQAVGKTDEKAKNPGGTVVERPISAPDFFATICAVLGIDPTKELMAPGERPMRIVDKVGKPIVELVG
jgi:uncharacterized protein (DUF1501 family)